MNNQHFHALACPSTITLSCLHYVLHFVIEFISFVVSFHYTVVGYKYVALSWR